VKIQRTQDAPGKNAASRKNSPQRRRPVFWSLAALALVSALAAASVPSLLQIESTANSSASTDTTTSTAIATTSSGVIANSVPVGDAVYDRPALYGLGKDTDRVIAMDDGVRLRADVYYPTNPVTGQRATGAFPVLLQQTVYGKQLVQISGNLDPDNTGYLALLGAILDPLIGPQVAGISATDVPFLVKHGYIVVVSDIRGTGQSEGVWELFQPKEATDGVTMVHWAAALPNSSGKVGLFGLSYMGMVAYNTMAKLPKGSPVKAAFPIFADNNLYRELFTQGGIPNVAFDYTIGLNTIPLLGLVNPALGPVLQAVLNNDTEALAEGIFNLIPTELQHVQQWNQFVIPTVLEANFNGPRAYDQDYWYSRSVAGQLDKIVATDIPIFAVGSWRDLFPRGALHNYVGLQNLAAGRPAEVPMLPGQAVTPRYQLIMGDWTHTTSDIQVIRPLMLEWFDTWLYDMDTPLRHESNPLHLYQMSGPGDELNQTAGIWRGGKTWPLQGTQASKFYFSGQRSSDTASFAWNDGLLTTSSPTVSSGFNQLKHKLFSSPCNMQTNQWWAGTPALLSGLFGFDIPCLNTGSSNDSTMSLGGLTYTTPAFSQDMVIAGPIDAAIYASLSRLPGTLPSDIQLVATIEQVAPNGNSFPISNGALLGSHRALDTSRTWYANNGEPLQPYAYFTQAKQQSVPAPPLGLTYPLFWGAVNRYDIEVTPTFARIPAGSHLRVTITTADTPHLFPTLTQFGTLIGGVYGIQHNRNAPSFINVPIFPASAFDTPCSHACPTQ
jgi:putative CocE/NonD family hydrolase